MSSTRAHFGSKQTWFFSARTLQDENENINKLIDFFNR